MPFVWVNEPQTPPQVEPLSYGPNTVSTQVGLVANSVTVHPPPPCTIKYNTPNVEYVIVCAYDTLNVDQFNIGEFTGNNVNANSAQLNNASINTSFITNATIANLNVQYLSMNTDPTANLHLATKGYVDALIANSEPLGGNLQLLILAAGDILAGVADNTAERVAVGTDNQLLTVVPAQNTKVEWQPSIFPEVSSFRNIHIGTSPSFPTCNTQVVLFRATEIIMESGTITNNWSLVTGDINTSGAGGLDANTVEANTWYEVYAIRNPSNGDRSLLFHKALDRRPHISSNISTGIAWNTSQFLNTSRYTSSNGTLTSKIAHQFESNITGEVTSVELMIRRVGTPNGHCWITLHDQEANGIPNTLVLSTSDIRPASELANSFLDLDGNRVRFIFRDRATIQQNNNYCIVINTDYATGNVSNQNYMSIPGSTQNTAFEQNGRCIVFSDANNAWILGTNTSPAGVNAFFFRVFVESNNTPVTMPTGYTERCLISYTMTDRFGSLKEYSQRDRKISLAYHHQWRWYDLVTTNSSYLPFGIIQPLFFQRSHALDAVYGVPPVPCLVTLVGSHGSTPTNYRMYGPANSHELSTDPNLAFREIDGLVMANAAGGGTFMDNPLGPIFCEEQCLTVFLTASTITLVTSSIEF